ncbi:DNA integrity scanning protein DisA [Clostridium tepidiprofundi DSM 19306]|uniref:Diadenylate cyclase n=1 Tax=Clostridium tepidiprofundi DSM 19306 TaxID=1121338 RepID=A0A151B636_9CLOT|nr:diadenylate cyclase CdaA [Clostridium tepidiprofundi]KYH35240.1 DNA integrity scanning protein DisA [Clostridium tepidiprofundi DSM 19306]
MDILNLIINTLKNITIFSILDIIVVSIIFYEIYNLIKETRAFQLLKGILLILLLIPISDFLQLKTLHWILNKTITIGVLTIVIIFQPEIRKALEHIGRKTFTDKHIFGNEEIRNKVVTEIVNAVENLAQTRTGALIIIEQRTGLGDVIDTGTKIDAIVSSALLENIFVVNTPLHDGATIIRNNRIVASGCFLPLTTQDEVNKKLGTRHRAAIGISEVSDALVIVVSEETGIISLAINGKLIRKYDKDKLKSVLLKVITNRQDKKITLKERVMAWKKKIKTNG